MNSILKFAVFVYTLSFAQAQTHDEISKCFLTGVHKTRQTVIESPNYPNNYKADTCWDYVIRSPFKCPTKFHIQFLYFDLEFSEGCRNDYLAIGLQNIDDDMDVLCGQVVGIKKYHTPDGVLRLRFFADGSPATTGKGFKLLITRLACEIEEPLRKLKDDDDDQTEYDDSIAVTAPAAAFQPPVPELLHAFRNLTNQDQYQTVPLPPIYGLEYPTQLPSPPYPATGTVFLPSAVNQNPLAFNPGNNRQNFIPPPCTNDNQKQQQQLPNMPGYYGALKGPMAVSGANSAGGNVQPSYIPLNYLNSLQVAQNGYGGFALPYRDQYIGSWSATPSLWRSYDSTIDSLEACCVSAFQQKRFYLSSPGFPRTIFSNILPNTSKRDCVFRLEKSAANVCRLRMDLKFFDFGQNYQGTGSFSGNIGVPAIQSTQDVCQEDFIEIDNQRFCGCRSGFTYTTNWATAADKKLRMRMGYSGVPSGGFLLELVQEECSETQLAFGTTERPASASFSTLNPNLNHNQLTNPQHDPQVSLEQQNPYGNSYLTQQQLQQQLPQRQDIPLSQQLSNAPGAYPTYFQPQNFPLSQQQKPPQFLPNNYLYPSPFGPNYFAPHDLHHNLLHQPGFSPYPVGLSQVRYARSYADQQPLTVVETNSTRKELYYAETEPKHSDEPASLSRRLSPTERSSIWDRKDTNINENINSIGTHAREGRKCTFNTGDILRLSVEILWVTRPICYAPQRNWFTNWIG